MSLDTISEIDDLKTEKGFTASKEDINDHILLKITFNKSFTDTEFSQFLGILDKFLHDKNKFVLLIDTRLCTLVQLRYSIILAKWMKKRKPDIPDILIGSAVVMNSPVVITLIKQAFRIQKPTSPNLMTKDYDKAIKFLSSL